MADQGTEEWHQARLGKVTASKIADVMMKPATSGYQNYRSQLVCERLTGRPTETFKSAAMIHGTETEPQARAIYEMITGRDVAEVGFIDHPAIAMTGASPDGIVGDVGLIEIKCSQPTEHIRLLTGGEIQRKYLLQMQWQMVCTGRKWCDFFNFNPDFPEDMQCFRQRVDRDEDLSREIEVSVSAFLSDVEETLAALIKRRAA